MSHESAMRAILTLLACYPNTKADDKFAKMAAMALAHYPDETLRAMLDPKDGIITQCHYMPSISQMKDFCKSYAPIPQKREYFTGTTPPPASQESKDRVDAIRASLPFMQKQHPPKVTESDLPVDIFTVVAVPPINI